MSVAEQLFPEVMDLMQAASYLGFHPVTLRDWKRKGEGPPGRKIGGRWRFHKPALGTGRLAIHPVRHALCSSVVGALGERRGEGGRICPEFARVMVCQCLAKPLSCVTGDVSKE